MANEAPERIWTDDECHYETRNPYRSHAVEYIRADLATLSSEQARDALTELDQLRDRVKELGKALIECEEYFDNRADADHDGIGFVANEEMKLQMMIRRVREGGKVDG